VFSPKFVLCAAALTGALAVVQAGEIPPVGRDCYVVNLELSPVEQGAPVCPPVDQ
jgi:hypothetical protein